MIGKIKNFKYNLLIILISVVVFINSLNLNINIFALFATSIVGAFFTTKYGIVYLKRFKFLQKIREEGPSSHIKKEKTPTMGGVFIVPIFLLILLFINIPETGLKLNIFITISGFFFIGLIDDFLSIKNKINLGLQSKDKFILQIIIASFFIISLYSNNLLNSDITFVNDFKVNLGSLIFPLSLFTIIALSNSVNLTDGLDGLASGCSAIAFCGLGTEIILNNDKNFLIFGILSYCMSGLCLGFLKLNKFPAKIFMGDTGSLSIGALIGIFCVITNSYFTTLIISGVFLLETVSVILQVSFFKITKRLSKQGKRLFLMTPIHHHFELKGFKEEKIVEIFWIINIILVIFSIVLKTSLLR